MPICCDGFQSCITTGFKDFRVSNDPINWLSIIARYEPGMVARRDIQFIELINSKIEMGLKHFSGRRERRNSRQQLLEMIEATLFSMERGK
jgi:hypothetical protein